MSFRRDFITKPIFSWARGVLPSMSDTEREALEAGDVWWDADLFTGNPDWSKLLAYAPATLTARSGPSSTARSTNSAPCSTTGRSIGNGATCRRRRGTSSSATNSSA